MRKQSNDNEEESVSIFMQSKLDRFKGISKDEEEGNSEKDTKGITQSGSLPPFRLQPKDR